MSQQNKTEIIDIQMANLKIMKEVHRVCEAIGVQYSLTSGSLLGAVRHKGFIPWDDDMDISMTRPNYEKFIKEAPKVLKDGFALEHYTTEKLCPNTFAKVVDINTTWICPEYEKLDIMKGIAIDVFPIDRVPNEKLLPKIKRKTWLYNKFKGVNNIGYIKTIQKMHKRMVAYCMFVITRIIGARKLVIGQDKFNKKYKNGDYTTADIIKRNKLMPYKWFEIVELVPFETEQFYAIKDREEYLSIVYGNTYMQLPPEDKRVTHKAKMVDVRKSYMDYLKESK